MTTYYCEACGKNHMEPCYKMTKEIDKLIKDVLKEVTPNENNYDMNKNYMKQALNLLAKKMQEENKYLYEQSEWIERKEITLALKEFEEEIEKKGIKNGKLNKESIDLIYKIKQLLHSGKLGEILDNHSQNYTKRLIGE